MYREEYNDCTSVKGRFHQYFIYGETIDCAQWKRDLDNCSKWKEENDLKAAVWNILSNYVLVYDFAAKNLHIILL